MVRSKCLATLYVSMTAPTASAISAVPRSLLRLRATVAWIRARSRSVAASRSSRLRRRSVARSGLRRGGRGHDLQALPKFGDIAGDNERRHGRNPAARTDRDLDPVRLAWHTYVAADHVEVSAFLEHANGLVPGPDLDHLEALLAKLL